jgi:hypothetical protein
MIEGVNGEIVIDADGDAVKRDPKGEIARALRLMADMVENNGCNINCCFKDSEGKETVAEFYIRELLD